MDYLLDKYIYSFLPFDVSDDVRGKITSKAVDFLRLADWSCKAQDLRKLVNNHTSLLAAEALFAMLYFCTLIHAVRHGRRYLFTWIGIVFICIATESLRFCYPEWDVIWHAQGTLTLMGMRIPLYLLALYHTVYYVAYVFARRLHVGFWAEGAASGLIAFMLYFPLNLMGPKLLWFHWHDSDPSVFDRWNSMPWTSHMLPAILGCSFLWTFHLLRRILLPEKYDWKLFMREFFCACTAGVLGVGAAMLQTGLLVDVFSFIWKIDMSVPTVAVLGFYVLLFFVADRHNNRREARPQGGKRYWFDELACALCTYYLFFMILPFVTDPENIISEGLHQPIGPCNITEKLSGVSGVEVQRQKYLCAYERNSKYFDFHCLPDREAPMSQDESIALEWYVMCGTDYENRLEYLSIIWISSLMALAVLYQIGVRSGPTPHDPIKVYLKQRVLTEKRTSDVISAYSEEQGSEDFEEERMFPSNSYFKEAVGEARQSQEEEPQDAREFVNENASVSETPAAPLLTRSVRGSAKKAHTVPSEYVESPRTLRSRKRNV